MNMLYFNFVVLGICLFSHISQNIKLSSLFPLISLPSFCVCHSGVYPSLPRQLSLFLDHKPFSWHSPDSSPRSITLHNPELRQNMQALPRPPG